MVARYEKETLKNLDGGDEVEILTLMGEHEFGRSSILPTTFADC